MNEMTNLMDRWMNSSWLSTSWLWSVCLTQSLSLINYLPLSEDIHDVKTTSSCKGSAN